MACVYWVLWVFKKRHKKCTQLPGGLVCQSIECNVDFLLSYNFAFGLDGLCFFSFFILINCKQIAIHQNWIEVLSIFTGKRMCLILFFAFFLYLHWSFSFSTNMYDCYNDKQIMAECSISFHVFHLLEWCWWCPWCWWAVWCCLAGIFHFYLPAKSIF